MGRLAFTDADLDRLRQELLMLHATHPDIGSDAVQAELQRRGFDAVLARILDELPPASSPAAADSGPGEVHAVWRAHLAVLRREALKKELASAAAAELSAESWERRRALIRAAMPAEDDDG